ncbi:MAG: addiction module protein [Candidatus Hodarchaeota archaeon]
MEMKDLPEISKLSIPEKILLVEDIWDSIIPDASEIPIPESHIKELNRRMDSLGSIGKLLTLDELKANINERK